MSAYALAGHLLPPLLMPVRSNRGVQDALIAADRLFEILDLEAEQESSTANFSESHFDGIRFEGVTFRYGTREPIFEGFDLTIPAHKITAIVGESGCGKSTLMALLQKVYPVEAGNIFYGDLDLCYVSSRSIRRSVTGVAQDVDLFSGSVLENIAFGDPDPNVHRALEVCEQAGIRAVIDALPKGLDTRLSGNSGLLSAGEKQRLAIARALYPNPDVIVFDEATSALDSVTESQVQETIRALADAGKTIILVAHRLSTILGADKIVVIADGRVVEEGDHEELIGRRGKYYELWQYQVPTLAFLGADGDKGGSEYRRANTGAVASA
jgi:ATP-binding cassette subfamily B protein